MFKVHTQHQYEHITGEYIQVPRFGYSSGNHFQNENDEQRMRNEREKQMSNDKCSQMKTEEFNSFLENVKSRKKKYYIIITIHQHVVIFLYLFLSFIFLYLVSFFSIHSSYLTCSWHRS